MAKILYEKMLIKFYSLHTMGTTHKPHIDIYTTLTQWGKPNCGKTNHTIFNTSPPITMILLK